MSVFNLKGFEAEAEVLGQLREVRYSGGSLIINKVDMATAKAIIDKLATGLHAVGLDGETQVHGYVADGSSPQPEAPLAAAQEDLEERAAAHKAAPAAKKTEPAKPKQAAAKAEPAKKAAAKAKPKQAPAKAPPVAEEPEDNVVPLRDDADADDLVAQLAKKGKLIDIVAALKDAGFDKPDSLIAKCEEIKDRVPVLKRIPSIPDRVKRVLERLSA